MDDVKKYSVGQKVICRASVDPRHEGMLCISEAKVSDPEYQFIIVGIRLEEEEEAYDYMLLVPEGVPKEIGWIFTEAQFDPDNKDEEMLSYNINREDVLGKRGIGCFEENILRLVAEVLPGPASCVRCSYKNEYMPQTPNYVCFNCRS